MINRDNYIVELFEDPSRVAALTRNTDQAEAAKTDNPKSEHEPPQVKEPEKAPIVEENKKSGGFFGLFKKRSRKSGKNEKPDSVGKDLKMEFPVEPEESGPAEDNLEIDPVVKLEKPETSGNNFELEDAVKPEELVSAERKLDAEIAPAVKTDVFESAEDIPAAELTAQPEKPESVQDMPDIETADKQEEAKLAEIKPEEIKPEEILQKTEPVAVPESLETTESKEEAVITSQLQTENNIQDKDEKYWYREKEKQILDLSKEIDRLKQELKIEQPEPVLEEAEEKAGKSGFWYNISFVAVIAIVIIAVLLYAGSLPRSFFGYSYHPLLSPSMQSQIPRGSLIVTKAVNGDTIKIGDTVTYYQGEDSTITHMVIEIHENYEQSGLRGFITKGVNNAEPDANIVYETDVVGVVVFHIGGLGDFITFIRNMWMAFAALGILLFVSSRVRRFLEDRKEMKMELGGMHDKED